MIDVAWMFKLAEKQPIETDKAMLMGIAYSIDTIEHEKEALRKELETLRQTMIQSTSKRTHLLIYAKSVLEDIINCPSCSENDAAVSAARLALVRIHDPNEWN